MLNKLTQEQQNEQNNTAKPDVRFARKTYLLLVVTIFSVFIIHILKLYNLKTDKFSYFIITLLFLLLLIPTITYIKAFSLVEIRKDLRVMRKN